MDSARKLSAGEMLPDPDHPRSSRFLRWVVRRRFALAVLRALLAATGIAVATALVLAPYIYGVFSLLIYLALFILTEYSLADAEKEVRAQIEQKLRANFEPLVDAERKTNRQLSAQADLYWGAQQKISFRIGKTAETIAAIVKLTNGSSPSGPVVLKKEAIIDEVLGDLCDALEAATSKSRDIPRPEAWFRATYMEVRGIGSEERLAFIAFHTPDGNMPNSMSQNKSMGRGEGDAGTAWSTRRPVIEDEFRDGHGWKDLYVGQGQKYKSMICIPVFRGTRDMANDVIGIITIDTRIKGFFGAKGNQEDEDKFAGIVRPYASYICLISALNDALTLPTLRAVPSVQSRTSSSELLQAQSTLVDDES